MALVHCVSSLGCSEASLDDLFELARRHRVGAVELRGLEGSLDLPAVLARRFVTPRAFAVHLAQHRAIRVIALDTSLRMIGNVAEDRGRFLEYVPWAEAAGVPWLRVFDGGKAHGDDIAAVAETHEWWQALRATSGWKVDVLMETHDTFLDGRSISALTARVPHLGILWDAHHTWRRGSEHPRITWSAIRSFVRHIHVKDSAAPLPEQSAVRYVLPGRGDFPMNAVLAALKADRYEGAVSLEWERHWQQHLPSLDDALSEAKANQWW